VNPSDTRVIDTNAMVEEKLKELSRKLAEETGADDGFTDGFMQGIDAMQVAQLVGDEQIIGEEPAAPTPPQPAEPTAEELINQAQIDIEVLKQQAQAEIDAAKAQAIEAGQKEGYEAGLQQGTQDGYAKGHQEGLDSVEEQRAAMQQEMDTMRAQLEDEYQTKLRELEPQFIDTLTDIYEHVFGISLKNNRELVSHLLANTMRNIESGEGFIIHVSRDDYPFVSMQKKEIIKGTSIDADTVDIVEDATLEGGECTVETDNGVFDCGLGTQLEALNEEIRLLAYTPKTATATEE